VDDLKMSVSFWGWDYYKITADLFVSHHPNKLKPERRSMEFEQ
jgi:hypothetical protein